MLDINQFTYTKRDGVRKIINQRKPDENCIMHSEDSEFLNENQLNKYQAD